MGEFEVEDFVSESSEKPDYLQPSTSKNIGIKIKQKKTYRGFKVKLTDELVKKYPYIEVLEFFSLFT